MRAKGDVHPPLKAAFMKDTEKKRPCVSISDVRYALESPWACGGLELGRSSRRRCLPSFLRRCLIDEFAGVDLLINAITLNRRRWL